MEIINAYYCNLMWSHTYGYFLGWFAVSTKAPARERTTSSICASRRRLLGQLLCLSIRCLSKMAKDKQRIRANGFREVSEILHPTICRDFVVCLK